MLRQQAFENGERTVEEEILQGCPAKDRFDRERFEYELEYDRLFTGFGFSREEKRKRLKDFSGGQQTKIALIRLLLQKPDILLLDEPTNHLDISYQYQIMDILKKQEATVFSSVHDLNLAALYCDRILFMYQGKIVDDGTPEEVLTSENLWKYFQIRAQISRNPATGKLQIYYLPDWI